MKIKKKYKMSKETMEFKGHVLHRIKAMIDIPERYINKGDLGGWIESEHNLSHEGSSWIADDATVYGYASVDEDAFIVGNAEIYGCAQVFCRAFVSDHSCVCGSAAVGGSVMVSDYSVIDGFAQVRGNAIIGEYAHIYDDACVAGRAVIGGHSRIHGSAYVYGDSFIEGFADIGNDALISGDVKIHSDAYIRDNDKDIMYVGNVGSRYDTLTAFRTATGDVKVSTGCFLGTLEEFKNAVKKAHGNNKYAKEYNEIIKLIKIHFEIKKEEENERKI